MAMYTDMYENRKHNVANIKFLVVKQWKTKTILSEQVQYPIEKK
jgi:hypothetical protein